ncbi:hypothetical protein Moror_8508 [Moniliophthora roreri MCA 2997]|uniref:Uncharacterized protein n=2 Tax=Moniliophthora roreri TaxID=221103 RepID=V2XMQ0_MONRO|nr:hypothetical protein Moror_8508 [Moniliophthora roreri MCA 2997]
MTLFHYLHSWRHILKKEAEQDSSNPESITKALTEHVHEIQYHGIDTSCKVPTLGEVLGKVLEKGCRRWAKGLHWCWVEGLRS